MLHRLSFRAMGSEMLAILDLDSEAVPPILNAIPARSMLETLLWI